MNATETILLWPGEIIWTNDTGDQLMVGLVGLDDDASCSGVLVAIIEITKVEVTIDTQLSPW